tara:strand:+ start:4604 stop:7501 length:2898 start_codon:yes stop_codon:yes gene_type:complete
MGKVIAAYGGGFKPPQKGHFQVVEEALDRFPEIDEFIIYIGAKERDGISQAESVLVWEIYQNYLPMKVKIEPVKAPIGDIIRLSKKYPQDTIYFIIGAREGNEEDQKDIASRTKGLEEKKPNIKVKTITTKDGNVSGTKARQAAKVSPEELFKYLPEKISDEDKQKVYDIVGPVIKEISLKDQDINEYVKSDFDRVLYYQNYYTNLSPSTFDVDIVENDIVISGLDKPFPLGFNDTKDIIQIPVDQNLEETLNEGRYDTISNKISSDIFRYWKEKINQGLAVFEGNYEHEGEDIEVEASLELSTDIDELKVDGGADDEEDFIAVNFKVNPNNLPGDWEKISFSLKDVIRHEIEHLTHGEGFMLKPGKSMENDQILRQMIDSELLPRADYFKLEKEIDANLQGMYFRAKKERRPFKDVVNVYLDTQELTPEEKAEIMNLWNKRTKALSLPPIQENLNEEVGDKILYAFDLDDTLITSQSDIIITNPEKGTFKLTPAEYAVYKPHPEDEVDFTEFDYLKDPKIIKNNFKKFSMILKRSSQLPNAQTIILTARKFEVAKDLEEFLSKFDLPEVKLHAVGSSDPNDKVKVVQDYIDQGYNKIRFWDDSPKNIKQVKTLNSPEVDVRATLIKHGPLGEILLKENATYSTHIDYEQQIQDLTQHMLDKGMNIEPLPQVEFVDGDSENAENFFGRTAYYDPNTQTIVLYTEGRHPKDIVRSFSHEMIHHIQNLEDRLEGIGTTNTTEDDNLNKIEQEAYLNGNITFRNWTDSLNEKKKKDYFGLNQFARELAQGLEEETENIGLPEEEVVSSQDMDYVIYSDMDGVIVDFEERFKQFSDGVLPSEFQRAHGREKFWDLIDNQIGVKFWVGAPWMPDGKQYWDYIEKYNPILLSSPSRQNESRLGKRLWVKKHIPGTPLKLAYSANKKNYARENAILIDDRKPNIDQWIEAGGIGILHINAKDTIAELKKLGL